MKTTKKQENKTFLAAVVLPLGLSVGTVKAWSWWSALALAVLLVLFVKMAPACRRRENLWAFFLVMIAFAFPNVHLLRLYYFSEYAEEFSQIMKIIQLPLFYSVLFSIEEVAIGAITRLLSDKQYPLIQEQNEGTAHKSGPKRDSA